MLKISQILTILMVSLFFTACDTDDGKMEQMGENIDDAVGETRDKLEDAADEVKDSIDDACEKATDENC